MPSIQPNGGFLSLSDPELFSSDDEGGRAVVMNADYEEKIRNSIPWCWSKWQELTGLDASPFSPQISKNTPPLWLSDSGNAAVWTFVQNYYKESDANRTEYIKKRREDSDSLGRNLYLKWFVKKWSEWGVASTIIKVLGEHQMDPYSVMKRFKTNQVPDYQASQVQGYYPYVAEELFGADAFTEDGKCILERVRRFLEVVVLSVWTSQKKKILVEKEKVRDLKLEVAQQWEEITKEDIRPSLKALQAWMKLSGQLAKKLKNYGDLQSVEELRIQKERMEGALESLGGGNSGKKLPQTLRRALELLATEQQVVQLSALLLEQITECDSDYSNGGTEQGDTTSTLGFDAEQPPDVEWTEGIEEYKAFTNEQVQAHLGLSSQNFPFFNSVQDPDGSHDPWTEDGRNWLQTSGQGVPLSLRWHQMVGVTKMVENAFQGKPVLLMDQVGLGKTVQIVGYVAALTYFREYYASHYKFPGNFADKKWRGQEGNIPDLPSVITVPVTLVPQFTLEVHKFLRHGTFDLLPYLGTLRTRPQWWTDVWSQCKNSMGRRIIITTPNALNSDFEAVMEADFLKPSLSPKRSRNFLKIGSTTIYSCKFLSSLFDEAQLFRNIRRSYFAAFALRECSESAVGSSATPLTNRVLDVWNIGRFLGIPGFDAAYDEDYKAIEKELRSGMTKDRMRLRESLAKSLASGPSVSSDILATVLGKQSASTAYQVASKKATSSIREKYAGYILHRTVWSLDYKGERISGLAPFQDHVLMVGLYPHEIANMESMAQTMMRDGTQRAALAVAGGDFYLDIRRSLVHPSGNPAYQWSNPTTIGEWEQDASRKLDALVQVIKWHQEWDNRPPLKVVDDKLVSAQEGELAPVPSLSSQDQAPDKILVYCAFPSTFARIFQVLKLFGIETLQIHGKIPLKSRTVVIDQFKNGGRNDARVLIVSSVGLTGLNLPSANILVVVDTLWSAQEDDQLIGRIWRHPQSKDVHVYRIIAKDSPDVLLNGICFTKATIADSFANMTQGMRKLFSVEDDDPTNEDEDSSQTAQNEKLKKTNAPKKKKMPKAKTSAPRGKKGASLKLTNVTQSASSRTPSKDNAALEIDSFWESLDASQRPTQEKSNNLFSGNLLPGSGGDCKHASSASLSSSAPQEKSGSTFTSITSCPSPTSAPDHPIATSLPLVPLAIVTAPSPPVPSATFANSATTPTTAPVASISQNSASPPVTPKVDGNSALAAPLKPSTKRSAPPEELENSPHHKLTKMCYEDADRTEVAAFMSAMKKNGIKWDKIMEHLKAQTD